MKLAAPRAARAPAARARRTSTRATARAPSSSTVPCASWRRRIPNTRTSSAGPTFALSEWSLRQLREIDPRLGSAAPGAAATTIGCRARREQALRAFERAAEADPDAARDPPGPGPDLPGAEAARGGAPRRSSGSSGSCPRARARARSSSGSEAEEGSRREAPAVLAVASSVLAGADRRPGAASAGGARAAGADRRPPSRRAGPTAERRARHRGGAAERAPTIGRRPCSSRRWSASRGRPELLRLLGGVFFLRGNSLGAAIAFKKAEALAPLDERSRFTLAMAYVVLGRRDWARPGAREARRRRPPRTRSTSTGPRASTTTTGGMRTRLAGFAARDRARSRVS